MNFKYWYGNQDALRRTIKKDLKVPYKEYDGNLWSIRYKNKPLFIAHMDTVSACNMNKTIYKRRGKIFRQNSGLGADDRAGVNLIMERHSQINFLFTRDEECGRKGAESIAKHDPFQKDLEKINCIVQLDCTGHKVIRGKKHGYCQDDLVDDIKKIIPDIEDSHGSFSDLDAFTDKKPGVNLSVGYYNQHKISEYLVLEEYRFVLENIMKFHHGLCGTYKIPEKKTYSYPSRNNQRYAGYSGYGMYGSDEDYYPPNYPKWDYTLNCMVYSLKDSGKKWKIHRKKLAKEELDKRAKEGIKTQSEIVADSKIIKVVQKGDKIIKLIENEQLTTIEDEEDVYTEIDGYEVCDLCNCEFSDLIYIPTPDLHVCRICFSDIHYDLESIKVKRKIGGIF